MPAESHQESREAPSVPKGRDAANARTRRAERAARTALRDGPIRLRTRAGEVTVLSVEVTTSPEGLDCLEVLTDPGVGTESHFKIYNPPTGVRRPDGSVEEDPIGALVEVLAMHGAAGTRDLRRRR